MKTQDDTSSHSSGSGCGGGVVVYLFEKIQKDTESVGAF